MDEAEQIINNYKEEVGKVIQKIKQCNNGENVRSILTSATLDNDTMKLFKQMWNVDSKGVAIIGEDKIIQFIANKLKINMFVDQFYDFEKHDDG